VRSLTPTPILIWRPARQEARGGETGWRLVKDLCDPHQDSIDIGSYRGSYTLQMRRYSQFVHAFEPMPSFAEEIARRFRNRVKVHTIALSNRQGESTLLVPPDDNDKGLASLTVTSLLANIPYQTVTVPVEKLDNLRKGDVGFIKIDVEGHEAEVIEGGREILIRCQPRLLVEIEERHVPGSTHSVPASLAQLGYKGFFVYRNRLLSIEDFDHEVHQNSANAWYPDRDHDRQSFSQYVNNFLFFASSEATALASRIALALSTGKSSKSFVYRPLLNPHAPNIFYERANEWRHG
jgi:FkbM family methyltransferase